MSLRFTHRLAAYCALLAMLCQLLLPFAHAAVMAQDKGAAWCGTGALPQWSLDTQQDVSAEQASKTMFCAVCATAGVHSLLPPMAMFILPLVTIDAGAQFAPSSSEFSYSSYAIPPPPRGPPLIS